MLQLIYSLCDMIFHKVGYKSKQINHEIINGIQRRKIDRGVVVYDFWSYTKVVKVSHNWVLFMIDVWLRKLSFIHYWSPPVTVRPAVTSHTYVAKNHRKCQSTMVSEASLLSMNIRIATLDVIMGKGPTTSSSVTIRTPRKIEENTKWVQMIIFKWLNNILQNDLYV